MSNLREVAGHSCVSSNLGMADWSERDVDRVAALGAAGRISPLGVDLFRWAYANDHRAAARVLAMLVKALRGFQLPLNFREYIAKQAMREFSEWYCLTCGGRSSVTLANGTRIECDACKATGLRHYTNTERMQGCGFGSDRGGAYNKVRYPLEKALELLRDADVVVNAALNRELERA